MSAFYAEKPKKTAEQQRLRVFAMTHKEPTKAADAWIADKQRIGLLKKVAQEARELITNAEEYQGPDGYMMGADMGLFNSLDEALVAVDNLGGGGVSNSGYGGIASNDILIDRGVWERTRDRIKLLEKNLQALRSGTDLPFPAITDRMLIEKAEADGKRIAEQDAEIKALREQVAKMPVVVGYVTAYAGEDGSAPSSISWINSRKEGKYINPIYLDPPQEPIQP